MLKEGRYKILLCLLNVANLDTLFWNARRLLTLMILITASILRRNNLLVLTTVTMEGKEMEIVTKMILISKKIVIVVN